MKFSLVCPTRNRTKCVKRLLTSLKDTVYDFKNVEILFALDEDDIPTHQFFHIIKTQQEFPQLNIHTHIRPQSIFTNRDYYNWLATKSSGQYIWASADDLVYRIHHWDKIIDERVSMTLGNKPDKVLCVGIKDNTPKPKTSLPPFPCFPLVTREAFNFFGFMLHPQLPTWGADYALYVLYTGANRYVMIDDDVYIEHISWHTKQTTEDATAANIRRIFGRLQHDPKHNVDNLVRTRVPEQIKQLVKYIQEFKPK